MLNILPFCDIECAIKIREFYVYSVSSQVNKRIDSWVYFNRECMPYFVIIYHNSYDSPYIDDGTTNPIHLSYKTDKKAYRAQSRVENYCSVLLCIVERSQSRGKIHRRRVDRQPGNINRERWIVRVALRIFSYVLTDFYPMLRRRNSRPFQFCKYFIRSFRPFNHGHVIAVRGTGD